MSKKGKWIGALCVLAMLLGGGLISPTKVMAKVEVKNAKQLRSAIEGKSKSVSVVLKDSIALTPSGDNYTLDITSDVNIDLNGYNLSLSSAFDNQERSMFQVAKDGKLTITNSKHNKDASALSGGAGDDLSGGTRHCLIVNSGEIVLEHLTVKNIYNRCSNSKASQNTNTAFCVMDDGNLTMKDCRIKNVKANYGYLICANAEVSDYDKAKKVEISLKNVTIGEETTPVWGGLFSGEKIKAVLEDVTITHTNASSYVQNHPKEEAALKADTGGIKVKSGSSLEIKGNCTLENIITYNNSGPICVVENEKGKTAKVTVASGAKLTIKNCKAKAGRVAGKGGAIIIRGESAGYSKFINHGSMIINANEAASDGGGIYIDESGVLKQNGTLSMSDNKAGEEKNGAAICVNGTMNLTSKSTTKVLKQERGKDLICVGGTLCGDGDVTQCTISDTTKSMVCVRVKSKGQLEINKGLISGGEKGVVNKGTTTLKDVQITGAKSYGIYQDGTCTVAGAINVARPVFLEKSRDICVSGDLNRTYKKDGSYEPAMTLQVAEDDSALGRKMIEVVDASKTATKKQIALMAQQGMAACKCSLKRALRAGKGTDQNGETNLVVLSQNYTVTYKGEYGLPSKYHITNVPADDENAWWHENYTVRFKTPVLYEKDQKSNMYWFIGWSMNKNAQAKEGASGVYKDSYVMRITGNTTWYGIWNLSPLVFYQGNYGTLPKGALNLAEKRRELIDDPDGATQYTFLKNEGTDGTAPWFEQAYTVSGYLQKYSFVGWSLNPDATYLDINGTKAGRVFLPSQSKKLKQLYEDAQSLGALQKKEGRDVIVLQAIYDAYPKFTAYGDISILDTQVKKLTQNQLLGNVIVEDEEDGVLKNTTDVRVVDFDGIKEELSRFQNTGGITITLEATDGYGNVTSQEVELWVIKSSGNDEADFYTRYINEQAYAVSSDKGGLLKNSVWYTKEDYVKTIAAAFYNLKHDTPVESWTFSKERMKQIQEFVMQQETAGLNGAEFLEKFGDCKNP
ncbi:MAG: hypothetical protein K6G01_05460 [Eubacterium sp.]|nr:hypothetical protein [Eubacterium sp.]